MPVTRGYWDIRGERLRPDFLEQLPGKMKLFSEFLGKQQWFVGDKGFKEISAYMKSSCFLPTPLYTKMACGATSRALKGQEMGVRSSFSSYCQGPA
ncbi:Glutathione S-transferase Yb-3 [Heterocephalus glaber]|uniref:Glutathione S-transferase Yb-3 n=1 Tax=Heterocephalus glaber TaxID=10181 RepID=G5BQX1_HETGA|nr:Glutathione S-transferase Yb-3 [Heterocephalus glaber]